MDRILAEQREAVEYIAQFGVSRVAVLWLSDWCLEEVLEMAGER